MKLLTVGNPKIEKGLKKGFLPFILHLAPADLSGFETCPKRTAGCTAACLNTAGRGGMFKPGGTNTIQEARKRKTRMFFEERKGFMEWLVKDITLGIKQAEKKGLTPVFRLNGTSDLSFEKYEVERSGVVYRNVFEAFPEVQFYDYTKILGRKVSSLKNYHLTFSAAESNQEDVVNAIIAGMNVAVVFDKLPETFMSRVVFDGDQDDLRFKDPAGVIVGLKAKGRARKDTSGFVRRIIPITLS